MDDPRVERTSCSARVTTRLSRVTNCNGWLAEGPSKCWARQSRDPLSCTVVHTVQHAAEIYLVRVLCGPHVALRLCPGTVAQASVGVWACARDGLTLEVDVWPIRTRTLAARAAARVRAAPAAGSVDPAGLAIAAQVVAAEWVEALAVVVVVARPAAALARPAAAVAQGERAVAAGRAVVRAVDSVALLVVAAAAPGAEWVAVLVVVVVAVRVGQAAVVAAAPAGPAVVVAEPAVALVAARVEGAAERAGPAERPAATASCYLFNESASRLCVAGRSCVLGGGPARGLRAARRVVAHPETVATSRGTAAAVAVVPATAAAVSAGP